MAKRSRPSIRSYNKKTNTKTQIYSYLKGILKNLSEVSSMNSGNPYIHNYVTYFSIGYATAKSTVINGILQRFFELQNKMKNIAKQASSIAQQQCKAMGFESVDEMNLQYRLFLKSSSKTNFFDYFNAIRYYKHARIDSLLNHSKVAADNQQDIVQLQNELAVKLKNVGIDLQKHGYDTADYNKLIERLGVNPYAVEKYIGNVAEPIVTELFKEFIPGICAEFVGKTIDKNTNTQDIKLTTVDGTIVTFSLKISGQINRETGTYSDFFTATRGNAAENAVKYSLENYVNYSTYGTDVVDLINYIVYNHQLLTGTQFTEEVLTYLRYIVGWELILSGLFGTGFQEFAIQQFPMFLMTQDRIISMADVIEALASFPFEKMKYLASQNKANYKFALTLGKGRSGKDLLQDKVNILKTHSGVGSTMTYTELKSKLDSKASLKAMQNSVAKHLSFKVHYTIALNNITNLM